MNSSLPCWAEEVIADFGEAKVSQWRKRWTELTGFLKEIDRLPDAGKKIVFERAVYVGIYPANETPREATSQLENINSKILASLTEAIRLMKQRRQLKEDHHISDRMTDLFDALSAAIKEYPDWAYVAQDEVSSFLRMRGQSRPRPGMVDLLESYVCLSDTSAYCEHDPVIRASQKTDADPIRHMLHQMGLLNQECLGHLGIGEDFRLTDAVIADLINLAFDRSEGNCVGGNAVKRRRQASLKDGYDYWDMKS